ncbi:glutaredoxin-like protein [Burkholderiales bacterium GJ-E10]|nr:glutaredoxin-like protein [Burkholderiales bacterium GJ-E10]
MKIELFYAPGCAKCAAATDELKIAAEATVPGVEWCEVNVLDSIDRAVDMGILTLPALAVDGELLFTTLPSPAQLTATLCRRPEEHSHGA